jgi:hypothetical protein
MDKPDRLRPELLTADDPRFTTVLDRRIGEMRTLLNEMEPASPAIALRALREAFPDVPLEERVKAIIPPRQRLHS